MASEPIRVLHVLGRLNMGGAETRIMDLYRHMDRDKVQFDFLVHYRRTDAQKADGVGTDTEALYQVRPQEDFDQEALSLGARIYVLPRFTGTNLSEYKKACHTFFARHHAWAVIEGHMTSMASVYLPIAKEEAAKAAGAAEGVHETTGRRGRIIPERTNKSDVKDSKGSSDRSAAEGAARIPVTIAHARSAGVDAGIRGAATRIFRLSLPKRCDMMMSCSGPASVSVFGEKAAQSGKVIIIPNALDLDAFRYDALARGKARAEYDISDDTLVIGHVGRFDSVKNQAFLAKVGAQLKKIRGQSCPGETEGDAGAEGPGKVLFLLVGKGDLQASVRTAFEQEGLGENVVFAGQLPREKTAQAYQAFDVFVLPSLYEGLPGTVIEAQAAGLPCVIADTITEEVAVTELVRRLPLGDAAGWAQAIAEAGEIAASAGEERHTSPAKYTGTTYAGAELSRKDLSSPPDSGHEASDNPAEISVRQSVAAGRARISADAYGRLTDAGYEIRSAARKMQEMYLKMAETSNHSDS